MKIDHAVFRTAVISKTVEVLSAFANAIEARDEYTRCHSMKVATLSFQIAKQLRLPKRQTQQLYWAAIVHDVGKVGIPEHILVKSGPLTEAEYRIMQGHASIGAKILSPIGSFRNLVPTVYHHHERYDGRGYPDRLAGGDIPLSSRILAVADSYDAMTSDRCYRPRLARERVLDEFRRNRGGQFDPEVTDALLAIVQNGGIDEACDVGEYTI